MNLDAFRTALKEAQDLYSVVTTLGHGYVSEIDAALDALRVLPATQAEAVEWGRNLEGVLKWLAETPGRLAISYDWTTFARRVNTARERAYELMGASGPRAAWWPWLLGAGALGFLIWRKK